MKMPVPREHGAWAMLYTPFLTAIFAAEQFHSRVLFLLVALTAIFFAHEPLLVLARIKPDSHGAASRRKSSLLWTALYLLIAVLASIPLVFVYELWLLAPLGALMVIMLALHYRLLSRKEERSVASEVMAIASLTASAPAACYVLNGVLDHRAVLLWMLNALYFTSSIFYVKVLVGNFSRKSRSRYVVIGSILYHCALLIILAIFSYLAWVPTLALIAFAPAVIRAFWALTAKGFRLNLRRVGMAEIAFTVLFLILLSAALRT